MPRFTLKTVLIADAVTCAAMFLLCVLAAAPAASLAGLPVGVVRAAGWICLASAALMLVAALPSTPSKGLANLIAVGNLGWVAASFAVIAIFAGQMSWLGIVVVAGQALVVLDMALLEARGAAALPRTVVA